METAAVCIPFFRLFAFTGLTRFLQEIYDFCQEDIMNHVCFFAVLCIVLPFLAFFWLLCVFPSLFICVLSSSRTYVERRCRSMLSSHASTF